MENLDKTKEKVDPPATMEEIRLKRLAYFQNLQPNSSSDTKELTVSCGTKPKEANDILPSFSKVEQTEQKTKLNTTQKFNKKEDMYETRNSKSDSHIIGLKKSSSPDKITHMTVKQTFTESDRRGSLAGSSEDSFEDDVNPGVLSKVSKPSESDGLPQFSVHRSVSATKLSATKWMSSEDVRHEQYNKHSQSIRNSGENKIESLFSSRRWTSACEVNTSVKDSVEVDKVSAFSSTVDFDDLGLSTHRPESNVNAESVQLQKQSVSLENLLSGQKAEELRDLLGEQKYREFVQKSERDLNMLHCQQSLESPLLSSSYSGERKGERANRKAIITPKNVPTPPDTQTYSNLKQSSSPCRRLRSNSPKMVSKMLQDIPQNNHAKETAMSKNYEQVVVPHNVTFSADEIYRQAYGSSENSGGGGDSGENELKRSVESWGLSYPDGMTSFWDNSMPQQVAGAYSPASSFSSSMFHRPFVPVAGDQPRYSYLPMNPNLNQVRPFVFSQGAAGMQGIPSPGQNMYPIPTAVLATVSPAGIFSPGVYQHRGNPPSLSMQSLYSPVGQSEDSVRNSVGPWQHLVQTPVGSWQHFGQKEPVWVAKERQSSSDSWLGESIRVMAPHPPINAPSKVHNQAGGEPSFTADHTARHIEAVRQHHQQKHESKEVAVAQKGAAAKSENLLEHYFSSLAHTPPSQPSSPHLTHHDHQREEVETAVPEHDPNEKNETLDRMHLSIGLPKDKDDDSLTTSTRTSLTMGTSIKAEGITPRMEELGVNPLLLCQLKTQTLSADQEMLKSLKHMVRLCPDCSFVNKEYMTWCLQCGTVLIGEDPVPAISLRKKWKPKKASSAKRNRPVSNKKSSDKTADHEGKMFQIVDKERMVEENKTRKDKETCLDVIFTEDKHPFENQVVENSKYVHSKESSESGNGTSTLSSPDKEVTSRKSSEERESQQDSLQEEAVAESKDSRHPSSGEGRGTDEGISHPISGHPERTEKEINEICEVISDPIIRGFIKSYFKKQVLQDGSTEKINSGQNIPSKGENADEKEHVSRCCNKMSDSLSLDLGLSLSSTAEGTRASRQDKVQEANKIQKSQRRSSKNGDEAIDVEIFAIEEARLSKSARCGANVVPALNLGCSSDEEDVLDEKIPKAPNCPGSIDQKTSRSEDDSAHLKAVNYSAEVIALLTVDPVPVDQPDQAQENRTGSGSIPRHFPNSEGHLVKSDHNRNTNRQQPLSKNARPSSASKIQSSNEAPSQSRHWARSSMAWSSYHPRELRTWSSTNIHQGSHGPGKWHKAGNARGSFSAGDLPSNVKSATHWPSQKTRPSSADQNPRTAQGRQSSSAQGAGSNGSHFGFPVQSLQHREQHRGAEDQKPRGTDSQHSSNNSGTALSPRFPETIEHRLPLQGNTLPLIPAGPTTALQIYDRCIELTPRTHDHDMSKWLLLPDEMWLHVFSYLPQKDLAKAACVCKQLYRVAMDETLWKHLTVKKSELCDEWLAQIAHRHPVSLALVHCHGNEVSSEGLRDLFREVAPYLQELNFSRCSKGLLTGDNILLHASTKCRSLTHVDASWCHVTDSGLSALAECSHRLESLCLNGCQMITDRGLESVVTKHGQSLRVLELFGCFGLTEPGFLSLGTHCGSLLTLNIGQCHKVTDSCMTILSASLGNLESLDLRGCKHIKDNCIRKIVRNCPRLKVLTLANCPSISDAAIKEIATYSADIRVLDVCGCQKVTDVSTRTLANNCRRLMELDISSTGCTDKSVLLLADLCRWLERAKLSFLPDITDHCVHKLIKNCTRLKTVHLFGCNKVNVAKLRTLNRFIKIEN